MNISNRKLASDSLNKSINNNYSHIKSYYASNNLTHNIFKKKLSIAIKSLDNIINAEDIEGIKDKDILKQYQETLKKGRNKLKTYKSKGFKNPDKNEYKINVENTLIVLESLSYIVLRKNSASVM